MQRRDFLRTLAATAIALEAGHATNSLQAADSIGATLPKRTLGKTGASVTALGLGGYHIGWTEERLAQATIEAALEEGVRFFDTAEQYGKGESESRYGRFLVPKYRDEIFLMTKTQAPDAKRARADLEDSLRRLGTDRLDLWQLHSLGSPKDVDDRAAQGVIEVARAAQREGKVRFIGFTGHASPAAHRRMLEAHGDVFQTCLMPINPVDAGAPNSFVASVLPELTRRDYGVLAMKTLADGRFFNRKERMGRVLWKTDNPIVPNYLTVADCIGFALSLPVAVLITGAEIPDLIREKAAMVRSFQKLSVGERAALVEKVADYAASGDVEYYKSKVT